MAATYSLISSNTLSGSAASVTFSSIPSTYTDLVLRASTRDTSDGVVQQYSTITFNGSTASVYSYTYLRNNNGNTVISIRGSNASGVQQYPSGSGSIATTNAFGSWEIYIPNYTSTSNIPFSSVAFAETNNTTIEGQGMVAGLWRGAAAISSITLTPDGAAYAAGSSFFLYGVKNA